MWRNERGGVTVALDDDRYLKWSPPAGPDLAVEAARLRWAAQYTPVPRVPNTLLDDEGGWTGHVDLGALGVADRWADLAVATLSTHRNYGDGWEDILLGAYGVAPDPARTTWYRLLWNAALSRGFAAFPASSGTDPAAS